MKRDHLSGKAGAIYFGYPTYLNTLRAVLSCENLDVDILLMLRQETFSFPDCLYFAFRTVTDFLKEIRASDGTPKEHLLQNTL